MDVRHVSPAASHPHGITIDNGNNVFIADTFNGRIRKCLPNGTCSDFVTNTYGFYDLEADSGGNVYGAATYEGIVVKYNSGGAWLGIFLGEEFVHYQTDASHFYNPRVAIDGQNNIIVVEETGQRLLKLDPAGNLLWSVGVPGVDAPDNNHLNYPHGVAVDAAGKIYVADNNRVQIFSGAGAYLNTIGGSWGSGNYQFQWASGIAVDSNGVIYVTDCPNDRVQVYNSSLTYVATIGQTGVSGSDNAHLNCPIGVGVDAARNIYVADAGNNRVQKFNSSRLWQMTVGTPGPWGSGSSAYSHFGSGPEDVAVDAQGRIFVADIWNNRVQVFNSTGGYLTTIGGEWGIRSGEFRSTSGVDVDSQGNVYVGDLTNHRIQKFAPGVSGWQQTNINGFGTQANEIISTLDFHHPPYAGT
jgi:sugar lactone lactonase YvrE